MNIVPTPPQTRTDLDADLVLRSYTKDSEWMLKTGVGGSVTAAFALLAAPLLAQQVIVLPIATLLLALTTGYVLRTVRRRLIDPKAKLPDWNDWPDLFFSGINWLVVQFVILVITIAFLATGLTIASFTIARGGTSGLVVGEMAVFFTLGILFWSSLLSWCLFLNFASEEKLLAGFALRKVIGYLRRSPRLFLTAWVLAVMFQIMSVIGPMASLIGVFLIPYTFFSAQLMAGSLLAQAWRIAEAQPNASERLAELGKAEANPEEEPGSEEEERSEVGENPDSATQTQPQHGDDTQPGTLAGESIPTEFEKAKSRRMEDPNNDKGGKKRRSKKK